MEHLPAEAVLFIEDAECRQFGPDRLLVRLSGRWPLTGNGDEPDPVLLVLGEDGTRHRFDAIPQPRREGGRGEEWSASFSLSCELLPRLSGHTWIALGETNVPVPHVTNGHDDRPRNGASSAPEVKVPQAAAQSADVQDVRTEEGQSVESNEGIIPSEEGRGTEPAEERFEPDAGVMNGTEEDLAVQALRRQLQERARGEARLRGEVAELRAELGSRAAAAGRFESIRDELRAELDRVRELVEQKEQGRAELESRAIVLAAERDEVRQQLQALTHERDEARQQLQALTHERDESRQQLQALTHERDEAHQQLQALTRDRDRLRDSVGQLRASAEADSAARQAAIAEAEALRGELERLGEQLGSTVGAAGAEEAGLDEAEALLQEARALSESLREQ